MAANQEFHRHRLEEMIELYNHLVALAGLTGSQKVYDSAWRIRRMIKVAVHDQAQSNGCRNIHRADVI